MRDDVNKRYRGKSPLVWAKEFENEDVVKALEEKGAVEYFLSEEEARKLGDKLIFASFYGNTEDVENFIEAGVDVDFQNDGGRTALINGCVRNSLGVIEKLVDAGANLDIQDNNGHTALIAAAYSRDVDIVAKLVDAGANLDIRDNRGYTALMYAIENPNMEILTKLIDAGADLNLKDNDGVNVLGYVQDNSQRKAILEAIKLRKSKNKELGFVDKLKGIFTRE